MGALVFINVGLVGSPYAPLLDNAEWQDLVSCFVRDACFVLGLTLSSPLEMW